MKIVDELFDALQLVQVVCAIAFFAFNYSTLQAITYHIQLDPHRDLFGRLYYTYDYLFVVNYYAILVLAAVVFLILILLSVNVVGSGLSDTGSMLLGRFLGYLIIYIVTLPAVIYYLSSVSQIIPIIYTVVLAFATILKMNASNVE